MANVTDHWAVDFGLNRELLPLINTHWLSFEPPAPSLYYALKWINIITAVFGCFGNGAVLLKYLKFRSLRTPANILVINLALSNLVMTLMGISNGATSGKTSCVIHGFVGGLTGTASIATLTAIALDRYCTVVCSMESLRVNTQRRAYVIAAVAWLYAAIFATIPALDIGYGRYVPEGYLTTCGIDYLTEELKSRLFNLSYFCAVRVVSAFIVIFCYGKLSCVVVCSRNKEQRGLSLRHAQDQVRRGSECKIARMLTTVLIVFIVTWAPSAFFMFLAIIGQKRYVTPLFYMISASFSRIAACINPFVYIIHHNNFFLEFKNVLFSGRPQNPQLAVE